MRSFTLTLGLAITLLPGWLVAQSFTTPDSALRAFHAAMFERRWTEAGRFVDPVLVERLRWEAVRSARAPRRARTIDDYLRDDPEMPREVAEYLLRRAEQSIRQLGNFISYEFAHVDDTAALKRLSSPEAAARFVQAQDPRYQIWMSFRMAPGCEGRTSDDAYLNQFAPRYELLATVVRGDTAWIMQRDTNSSVASSLDIPEIVTLFRGRGRWFVDLERPRGSGSGSLFPVQCTRNDTAAVRRP